MTATIGTNLLPGTTHTTPPGGETINVGLVSSWAGILLRCEPTSGFGKVHINWWNDAAFTQPAGSNAWRVNTLTALIVAHPLRAQYVTVSIDGVTPTNPGMNWNSFLAGTNDLPGRISYPVVSTEIHNDAVTIPASGS
jgi:hypothetical protein